LGRLSSVTLYPAAEPQSPLVFRRVDGLSYVNQDSYGPGAKMALGESEDREAGEQVLVVNVNEVVGVLIVV
jgi:hypothetical protein